MSDTPRTDEEVEIAKKFPATAHGLWVSAEFARQLEREAAAARHNEDVFRVLHLDSEKVIEGLREALEELLAITNSLAPEAEKAREALKGKLQTPSILV